MKGLCRILLLSVVLIWGNAFAEEVPRDVAGLTRRLEEHLARSRFAGATWGVKIVELGSGKTVWEYNAHKLLKPASNAKLFTCALAIDRLGPEYRIRTSLYARQAPGASGVVEGDLVVFGRGDPGFAARFHNGSSVDNLGPLANALTNAGVRRIAGDLVADESFFRGPPLGSGWMWEDLELYYGAEVSALTVEDNVVDLAFRPAKSIGAPVRIFPLPPTTFLTFSNRTQTVPKGELVKISIHRPVGENTVYVHGQMPLGASNYLDAVSVHRPAAWFASLFKESLVRRKVTVEGGVRSVNWLDREIAPFQTNEWTEIASVESPELLEIVTRTLKSSQNLYAQLLLLQVGARVQRTNAGVRTTEAAGLAEMRRFLRELRIRSDEVVLDDGSGLSRSSVVTPNAIVSLLRQMATHRHADLFRSALPLAGVDGTLRRRMKGTAAAGNLQGKTGTLRDAFTLAGYLTTRAGDKLAFSLMLNQYNEDETAARGELDAIAVWLAELDQKL